MMHCYYAIFKTSWGWCGLVGSRDGLTRLILPQNTRGKVRKLIHTHTPEAVLDHASFKKTRQRLLAYFSGQSVTFPEKMNVQLPPFIKKVLNVTRKIPYAQTMTYRDISNKIKSPGAARAVGNALGSNPVPIIIPCHRVLRTNGQLGGYSGTGGVGFKKRLLQLEHKCTL